MYSSGAKTPFDTLLLKAKQIEYPNIQSMKNFAISLEQTGIVSSFAFETGWEQAIKDAKELNCTMNSFENDLFIVPSHSCKVFRRKELEQDGEISSFAFNLGFETAKNHYISINPNISKIEETFILQVCERCRETYSYSLYNHTHCTRCNIPVVEKEELIKMLKSCYIIFDNALPLLD